MTPLATVFLLIAGLAVLVLPRRWAPLPLLVGSIYMPGGEEIQIGPFHFPVIRILILIGFVRILFRRERVAGRLVAIDALMLAWAAWAIASSAFHGHPRETLVFRLGLVYNALGIYTLIRTFCWSVDDIVNLIKITCFVLVPIALEMVNEQLTGRNFFSLFGGVSEDVSNRNDRFRAQGPFAHSILAGTMGAVCFPLAIGIWHKHRTAAKTGVAACLAIVYSSASSGPLMSLIFSIGALLMWRYRHMMSLVRKGAVIAYILLDLVMKSPAYFLIARIDLAGGSTGWHRAELIHSSIKHLNEWWFAGTDFTRHWMPTGVSWNPDHTDITNHYIQMGVWGGLPMMILFFSILWKAFSSVGGLLNYRSLDPIVDRFMIWALGASLFAHAASFISVSYFDQSFVFLYLDLGIIGSLYANLSQLSSSVMSFPGENCAIHRAADAEYVG